MKNKQKLSNNKAALDIKNNRYISVQRVLLKIYILTCVTRPPAFTGQSSQEIPLLLGTGVDKIE
jgi:hypothetical protein